MAQESRRKVLKGLAVTVPAVWATPVVESIILPAHAGFSCGKLELFNESDEGHQKAEKFCLGDTAVLCEDFIECMAEEFCIKVNCT